MRLKHDSFFFITAHSVFYLKINCFRRLTIIDSIERSLRKGRGAEQGAAAELAPLLCVQLGSSDASEEVARNLKPVLSTTANDNSAPALARAKVNI